MSRVLKQLFFLPAVAVLAFQACNRAPELPVIPVINFEQVQFKEVDGPDSLIVSIYFEDGDGDLGLTSFDITEPYQPYDPVYDANGDSISIGSQPGLPPYNPIDYVIIRDQNGVAKDTILVELNENHYNFFVRFFTKKNGQYTEFKWRDAPYYQTFDGRFPLLNRDVSDGRLKERPLEGELRYGMTSSGWLFLFRDTLKISVQIQDRALNKSNVVESPDFTLESIRVNP
jgi:hypothetical protein